MGGPRVLRAINDRAALFALLRHGPLTRIEVEQRIGLSKPAAAELLRRLEQAELVRRAGHRENGGPGPNAQLWSVNPDAGFAAGVDVRPSGMSVGIADLTGTVRVERHQEITPDRDPLPVLRRLMRSAVRAARLGADDLRRTVVGISGSIDPVTGRLEYAQHMPAWLGFDVPGRLSAALGMPVTVENDVNLVAIGESLQGAARGYRDVVLLWMGEGVAAGLIVDGRLHRGSRGGAGELDLAPIGAGGQALADLLESERVRELALRHKIVAAHGRAAVRAAADRVENAAPVATATVTGLTLLRAERFLDDLADRIAQGLVGAVALLDPELVLLGGDIGQSGGHPVARRVAERLHGATAHRPVVRAVGERFASVLDGATAVAVHQLRDLVFGDPTGPPGDETHDPGDRPRVLADLGWSTRPLSADAPPAARHDTLTATAQQHREAPA